MAINWYITILVIILTLKPHRVKPAHCSCANVKVERSVKKKFGRDTFLVYSAAENRTEYRHN